ncbi:MAG: glycoside hydrolase family 2 TIM barrel-domain containing protein [Xanthomonadales bacterium]|nr:glycoside hydrolase family 2 TIM barrel-domain containing protein [Xanthomonadales bacterium]
MANRNSTIRKWTGTTALAMACGLAAILAACGETGGPEPGEPEPGGAIKVEVVKKDGGYLLLRGGEPYTIKGAGLGHDYMENFASHGGNSFRNWGVDSVEEGLRLLDQAEALGLTVAMCLDIGRERQGFDYDDETLVARQFERIHEQVMGMKDHPALLLWIIGNEPDMHYSNPKVFDAINGISRMIHEVDGKHPTTTTLASSFTPDLARLVEERAPDLDIVSLQKYADVVNVPRYIREAGIDQPYLVTEWGPQGHWEVEETAWGAPIEPNSSEKAQMYQHHYETAVSAVPEQILGSYVFFWDQKQERTPTWYSLFLPDGSETESIDYMHHVWNGTWPENRAPQVQEMLLDGQSSGTDIVLETGGRYETALFATDPDGDALSYTWVLKRESEATQVGGDREEVPEVLEGLIESSDAGTANLTAPATPGAYRLFVYVHDGRGSAGYANTPFLVE